MKMKLALWLGLTKSLYHRNRSVSDMTFDLKQELFTHAVDTDNMELMRRLLELAEYQKIRRLHQPKDKLVPFRGDNYSIH